MASRYYGVSKGVNTVTEGSSTTSKQLELIVDLSKSMVKSEVMLYLDLIKQKVLAENFPATTAALLYRAWYMNRGQTQRNIASGVPTYATGTVTLANVSVADTVTFDGTVLTARAATPGADEFLQSGTDAADATDFVRAFNANATIATKAVASSTGLTGVVTITPILPGTAANAFTLVSSNGTRLAVSGAGTLTGGLEITSGDVRLKLLSSGSYKKADFAVGIQRIRDHLLKGNWPPA